MDSQSKPFNYLQLILVLGALGAIGPFSIDMYLPGFPQIARDYNTDIAHVGLSLTSFFAGICIGQLMYGPLLDRFGRKKPLLFGLFLYMVAALACALAPTLNSLIAMRGLMAMGGCAGMVASRAMVRDLFPPAEMAKVFSTLMLVMGGAPIVAPSVGGLVSGSLGWRWIFYFLTFFSALMLVIVWVYLPESHKPDKRVSLKPGPVLREYLHVLRHPEFVFYGFGGGIIAAGLFAYISGAPALFMGVLHIPDNHFAWLFGFNALGYIASAQLNRVILRYYTPQQVVLSLGLINTTLAIILTLVCIYAHPGALVVSAMIFLFMFSLGPLIPNTTALALRPFKQHAGAASGLIGSVQMMIAAVASAAVAGLSENGGLWPMPVVMSICAVSGLVMFTTIEVRSGRLRRLGLAVN